MNPLPHDERLSLAGAQLSSYLRLAGIDGRVSVYDHREGRCLAVTLRRLTPEAFERVPPAIDGWKVRVLV